MIAHHLFYQIGMMWIAAVPPFFCLCNNPEGRFASFIF